MAKRIDLDNWEPVDPTNPLKSLAHEVDAQLDIIEADIEDLRKEVAKKVTITTATTTTTSKVIMVGGAPNPFAPIVVTAPPGYKAANLDDGIELSLDTLAVQLPTTGTRSLQFRVTAGTMSVNISGEIYWNGGNSTTANYQASYWTGNTLNTTYQQIFGWSFPAAGDKAVYNVQDMTNRRFYRITLIIGPSYKKNFIIMERLV